MKKWFHAIGVSGKTTANIAKMFQDMGWFVTGSDMQFLPPASDILTENKINTVEGYHFSHLTKEFWQKKLKTNLDIPDHPDLGLIMSFLTPSNKEYRYAKLHNIDIRPYAKVLSEYLIKENSIVVAGTAGKTTTTALISYILQKLGFDPSYMIGADAVDLSDSIANTKSTWSVMEGDEYHSPELEGHAKFMEYKPKYLVLTNIGWEHQDIFPTQKDYTNQFADLVGQVSPSGLIVAKEGDVNIDKALKSAKCKIIRYKSIKSTSEIDSKDGQKFYIKSHSSGKFEIYSGARLLLEGETKLIGEYNFENILAAVALILNLPASQIDSDIFMRGTQVLREIAIHIQNFGGVKKRLEILYSDENLVVIDDFGVAPSRAKNSLRTLKERYENYRIIAVFEPNGGSRPKDKKIFNQIYSEAFKDADEVIIPDLSDFSDKFLETNEFVEQLSKLGVNVEHISSANLIENLKLKASNHKKIVVVFFSSYRLTKIAENLTNSVK